MVVEDLLEEAWNDVKPHLITLVFDCIAHVHVTRILRKKLDDKSVKYIFLEYEHVLYNQKLQQDFLQNK